MIQIPEILAKPVRLGYVGGDARLRVEYEFDPRKRRLHGRAWFGPGVSGAPGHAHGGSILAVLDEAMGLAAWMSGHYVMSVRLTTEFLKMLPLGTEARVEAHVARVRGRRVHTVGAVLAPDGAVFARARALFVKLSPEHLDRFRRATSPSAGTEAAPSK